MSEKQCPYLNFILLLQDANHHLDLQKVIIFLLVGGFEVFQELLKCDSDKKVTQSEQMLLEK